MKQFTILFVVLTCLLWACQKDSKEILNYEYNTELQQLAKLKINYAAIQRSNPGFQIKINETKVSGLITARYPYPGGGFNTSGNSYGDYLAVPTGTSKIKMSIPNVGTNKDSVVLYEGTINLAEPKYYTLHIADTGANIKTVLFQEDLTTQQEALPKFKLVNLMPNVPAIDLYFGATLVASNITYLGSSNEFTVDTSQTNNAWTVRAAGTGVAGATIATYTSTSTINLGRKYTAFAMGYNGLTATTEPRRPFISFFYTK